MEKNNLPNEKAVMILGILAYIGCCCTSGFGGVLLSGIGLYLAKKDEKLLSENPEAYNLGSLNTWKTVNLIALILSGLSVIYTIYSYATGQAQAQQEQLMELINNIQNK